MDAEQRIPECNTFLIDEELTRYLEVLGERQQALFPALAQPPPLGLGPCPCPGHPRLHLLVLPSDSDCIFLCNPTHTSQDPTYLEARFL